MKYACAFLLLSITLFSCEKYNLKKEREEAYRTLSVNLSDSSIIFSNNSARLIYVRYIKAYDNTGIEYGVSGGMEDREIAALSTLELQKYEFRTATDTLKNTTVIDKVDVALFKKEEGQNRGYIGLTYDF